MRAYSEALESKLAAIRWESIPDRPTPDGMSDRQWRALRQTTRQALGDADTYYISDDICRAVLASADSLPADTTVAGIDPPSGCGWLWLETPIDGGIMSTSTPVKGLLWYGIGHESMPEGQQAAWSVVTFGGPDFMPRLESMHLNHCLAPLRTTTGELDASSKPWLAKPVVFLAALSLWLQQRIVTVERQPADRATRRRIERGGFSPGSVNIVHLRRGEARDHASPGQTVAEWSCRWIVRGHWRQQYYPSTNQRRPLWIMPHVKGPDAAPLRPPSPTVFAVTR